MKFTYVIAIFISFFSVAQPNLDFDMDVTTGVAGGYAGVTYTITNLSPDPISNLVISHPHAVITLFNPTPSTLAAGATLTASGQIAISGEYNPLGIILGSTQAAISGILNGNVVTELSDGISVTGNRVEDGPSEYQGYFPQRYGVIYVDVDLNGNYDNGIDSTISGAVINIADQNGNIFFSFH